MPPSRLQTFAAALTPPSPTSTSIHENELERSNFARLCFQGILDSPTWIRAQAWKVLLGQLDSDKLAWDEELSKSRNTYWTFLRALMDRFPSGDTQAPELDATISAIDKDIKRTHLTLGLFAQSVPPHPDSALSPPGESDVESNPSFYITQRRLLFDRLDRLNPSTADGLRNRHDTSLDQKHSNQTTERFSSSTDASNRFSHASRKSRWLQPDMHWEAIERLLYVYAALNPSQGYVQGMNQVVSPVYHAFAQDSRPEHACHAEADAFACFTFLMTEMKDFLADSVTHDGQSSSNSSHDEKSGVALALHNLSLEISWLDSSLSSALHIAQVHPFDYAFSWFLTLFGQNLSMPELSRLFDSVFSLLEIRATSTALDSSPSLKSPDQAGSTGENPAFSSSEGGLGAAQAFCVDVAAAIVTSKGSELVNSDFPFITYTLQNYFCQDIDALLLDAFAIRDRRIAVDLTGDGPFLQRSENTSISPIRQRIANQGIRRFWAGPATDQQSDALASSRGSPRPHSPSVSPESQVSVQITPPAPHQANPNSGFFSKYTKAFAASDAAASISKASTNARIMAAGMTAQAAQTNWRAPSNVKGFLGRSASPALDPPFLPPIDDDDVPSPGRNWFTSPRKVEEDDHASDRYSETSIDASVRSSGRKPLFLSSAARPAASSPPMGSAATETSSRRSSLASVGDSKMTGHFARSPSPRPANNHLQYRSAPNNSLDFANTRAMFENSGRTRSGTNQGPRPTLPLNVNKSPTIQIPSGDTPNDRADIGISSPKSAQARRVAGRREAVNEWGVNENESEVLQDEDAVQSDDNENGGVRPGRQASPKGEHKYNSLPRGERKGYILSDNPAPSSPQSPPLTPKPEYTSSERRRLSQVDENAPEQAINNSANESGYEYGRWNPPSFDQDDSSLPYNDFPASSLMMDDSRVGASIQPKNGTTSAVPVSSTPRKELVDRRASDNVQRYTLTDRGYESPFGRDAQEEESNSLHELPARGQDTSHVQVRRKRISSRPRQRPESSMSSQTDDISDPHASRRSSHSSWRDFRTSLPSASAGFTDDSPREPQTKTFSLPQAPGTWQGSTIPQSPRKSETFSLNNDELAPPSTVARKPRNASLNATPFEVTGTTSGPRPMAPAPTSPFSPHREIVPENVGRAKLSKKKDESSGGTSGGANKLRKPRKPERGNSDDVGKGKGANRSTESFADYRSISSKSSTSAFDPSVIAAPHHHSEIDYDDEPSDLPYKISASANPGRSSKASSYSRSSSSSQQPIRLSQPQLRPPSSNIVASGPGFDDPQSQYLHSRARNSSTDVSQDLPSPVWDENKIFDSY